MDFTGKVPRKNPFKRANVLSKIFFVWIIPLFRKGKRKTLELDDLYDVPEYDLAGRLGDQMEAEWMCRMKAFQEGKKKPNLAAVLFTLLGRGYLMSSLGFIIGELVFRVAQPIILRELIKSFSKDKNSYSQRDQYLLAAALTVSVFGIMFYHPSAFYLYRVSMRCRVSLSSLIYRKVLRLSTGSAYQKTNVGAIVNLLSNDVNRFDQNLIWIFFIPLGCIQLLVFAYFLYSEFGPAAMTGLGALLVLIPFQYFNGKLSAKYRFQIAERTDERGRVMSEIISGIRIIKMYAWEKPFSLLIHQLRKFELKALRKRLHLKGAFFCLYSAAPKFFTFITILTFVLEGNDLSADQVFFATSLYFTLSLIWVGNIPLAMAGMGEIHISLERVRNFLLLEEKSPSPNFRGEGTCKGGNPPYVTLRSVSAKWTPDSNSPTLSEISTSLSGDKLVCVVGPCGSGKSSFLNLLLGELPIIDGHASLGGWLSYASQEPWVFAASVRKNILFGRPFVKEKYDKCVKAACLLDDFKQFSHGDNTVVGERGVSLSGGQKARVSLARCLYQKADIYLMDDPLSAVDARVSRHIFENCIQGYLRGKLRILVTHQLNYLPQADHIIVLKEGKIYAQGSYQELVDAKVDFMELMLNEDEEQKEKDDDQPQKSDGSSRRASVMSSVSKGSYIAPDYEDDEKDGKLKEETKASGSVGAKLYLDYLKMGRSSIHLFLTLFMFLFCQLSLSAVDYFLSLWTNAEVKEENEESYLGRNMYIYIYSGLMAVAMATSLLRSVLFLTYTTRIGINVHNVMFSSLVRAKILFFDQNPSGRIMNRFTKDLGSMDELLPPTALDMVTLLTQLVGAVAVVIVSNYYMAVPAFIVFILLLWIRGYYVKTTRDVKRIEGITKSPIFTHSAATFAGLTTIRALKAEQVLTEQFDALQDVHSASWFLFFSAARAFGVACEILSALFLSVISVTFILMQESTKVGNVGLAISAALTLNGELQYCLRQSAEVENQMTSVERCLEYSELPSEAFLKAKQEDKQKSPNNWPQFGEIEFKNVYLSYDEEKPVLRDLSFKIRPSEKIGIVGRTGAGKSSIIAALFRLTEPEGEIRIDNVDIKNIGLHDLRKNISIIPQDPVLFSGTIRYNLDPFNQFQDDQLWSVLEDVELKNAVPALDFHVADGGSNFSVGQRQLVCLARAILRKNKIIVMDEATANIDICTDNFIQNTIRTKFADCSIITVAHRLNTVIDCDRILVLDKGCLKEYDSPWNLLKEEHGVFRGMVDQLGKGSVELFKRTAQQAHETRLRRNITVKKEA